MKRSPEYYKVLFVELMNAGVQISNSDGAVYEVQEDEIFYQCYKATNAARSALPPYWFVSNKGCLISVQNSTLLWMKTQKQNGRDKVAFYVDKDHNRSVRVHNLVGLTFGVEAYGKAGKILDMYGLEAFIDNESECIVHCHHILAVRNHPELVNDVNNLQYLTRPVHSIVSNADKERDFFEDIEYMRKLSAVATDEEPTKMTVLTTGTKIDNETGDISHGNGDYIRAREMPGIDDLEGLQGLYKELSKMAFIPIDDYSKIEEHFRKK